MSRVAYSPPQRVTTEARKRLTAAEKSLILERQHDLCGRCGLSLVWGLVDGKPVYGPMIDEHIIPLGTTGTNDLSNRQLWCVECAHDKTKRDLKAIAKAKRLAGETCAKPKRKWPKRAFQKRRKETP